MEADRRHTTTVFENPKSCFKSCLDLTELVVDGDSYALKRSGRNVDLARPCPPGDGRFDGGGQVARGAQRAARHDELCDPARPTLLAVFAQDPLELSFVELVDDARRVESGSGVHPHVQRAFAAEAESAMRGVELDAGETEVKKDHVGR